MAAWNAYVGNNGTGGTRNPVGSCMFGNVDQPATARPTRATTAGEVQVPTRGMDTLVTHGLKTWIACAELREARTKNFLAGSRRSTVHCPDCSHSGQGKKLAECTAFGRPLQVED
jgi:hypothetical protein